MGFKELLTRGESELWETLAEDVVLGEEDWDGYGKLLHEDIPYAIRDLFEENGVHVYNVYHSTVEGLWEYIIETSAGIFALTVILDFEAGEVTLAYAEAMPENVFEGYRPYYHPCGIEIID